MNDSPVIRHDLSALPGLERSDPDRVAYVTERVAVALNSTALLRCGSAVPTLFIWAFSKMGSSINKAIAYNYGQGAKILPLASTLGRASLPANTSTLHLEGVEAEAEGLYTCQALYDASEESRVTFYYTQLSLEGQLNADKGKGPDRAPPGPT
ncbi:V-set and immunoglobulin domain-containing protein 10-like 2 isoform X2 [Electrophorus electricus]|uniref:V-set and immunoglobulin domain-containing protein 10-like 2 isoform X2 n=1 Tax=Electrophorus electricus TaxID=8005 RepID=UPI0015D061EC|nr:V-set and immunoglobulin domain-containing protein 10-like 2 isoform X2 [Electrophorus electricus]